MKKIAAYSGLLILGLILSQVLPLLAPAVWVAADVPVKLATMFCLAFIMIRVGFEFTIDKSRVGEYAWDYAVAAARAASCHFMPTSMILSGIMSSTVSRSSKIARMRAFLKTQVVVRPAAASMEKRMPAEVGAENRPIRSACFQASHDDHASGGLIAQMK